MVCKYTAQTYEKERGGASDIPSRKRDCAAQMSAKRTREREGYILKEQEKYLPYFALRYSEGVRRLAVQDFQYRDRGGAQEQVVTDLTDVGVNEAFESSA